MKTIGITGPTGCGKTTLLREISARGGVVIDCDSLYYELLKTDAALRAALTAAFGSVFLPDGSLDRRTLAARVFSDAAALAKLNEIVFFHVGRAVRARQEGAQKSHAPLFAIDAINLFESGLDEICDVTLGVLAREEVRLARIMARDDLTRAQAQARIDAQKKDDFYREHCAYLLENNTSPEAFRQKASTLLDKICKEETPMTKEQKEQLLYQPKNGYDRLTPAEEQELNGYCEAYKKFLDESKTERECVFTAIREAQLRGFQEFKPGMEVRPGDKLYWNNRGKAIMLAVIGQQPLCFGANIGAAHTDAPRLDIKPNPLYEEAELAYLKTHHYGGIRKYQWVTVPLELHGKVVRRDGSEVYVTIGNDPSDPQLVITDLLPHLGREQGKKPLNEAIPSESLNILLGSRPEADDDGKDRVKLSILRILNEKYGMVEEDFISAELEAVPAANARDIGLDRSLIGAYGHDDRVCAYAELAALFAVKAPEKTAVCIFADKEEIGSEGVSGMQGEAFEYFMQCLCQAQGADLRQCLANSFCLSADVCAAFDPGFSEVFERKNSAYVNYGVGLCKYTGSGGKSGASDASSEVVGKVRKILNDDNIAWQMCELGKTDAGGGGTVAKYMAKRNIDTLDAGVPVLSMHAPFEVVSKFDCYMTYRAVKAIFEKY